MKLGHVVKAGLLAGVFASTAQAQSLTGTLNGSNFSSPSGVVGPCDIGLAPILGVRSCNFANSVVGGGASMNVNGAATVTYNAGLGAYVYRLDYNFAGSAQAQPNANAFASALFSFKVPVGAQWWTTGKSSITTSVTVDRQSATLLGNGSLSSFATSETFLGAASNGSSGLNLNPVATAVQPIVGVPLTVSDTQLAGPNAVNVMFDQNVVSFGFDLISPSDRSTFSGTGYVEFTNVVPEPSTYALFATGLLALGVAARRRRSV